MEQLGGSLPETGSDPRAALSLLDKAGSPVTMAIMGRRFFGGVIGGSLPVTVAAHWIADAWDQNACLYELSPVSAYIEEVVLQWLLEVLGLPSSCGGALVTGTQMADVTALAAARHTLLDRVGWDADARGLFDAPPITVLVGEEVHATMLKALALIGFGRTRITIVPADNQGSLIPSAIPRLPGPVIICAQLGNVNSGAFDSISEICDVAEEMGAWVHVDGAFGLWADATPRILNDVQLNQILVAFDNDEKTQRVIDAVQNEGTCWCGGTFWRGRKAMRISVCSWATTLKDIEVSAASIIAAHQGT